MYNAVPRQIELIHRQHIFQIIVGIISRAENSLSIIVLSCQQFCSIENCNIFLVQFSFNRKLLYAGDSKKAKKAPKSLFESIFSGSAIVIS